MLRIGYTLDRRCHGLHLALGADVAGLCGYDFTGRLASNNEDERAEHGDG